VHATTNATNKKSALAFLIPRPGKADDSAITPNGPAKWITKSRLDFEGRILR
jgi:hypothetical protein